MNQRSLKSGILSFKQVLRASHLFCIADSTGQEGNTNIISIVLVRNKLSLELSHLVVFKSYSKFYKTLKKPYNACMALEFYSSNSEKKFIGTEGCLESSSTGDLNSRTEANFSQTKAYVT